MVSNINKGSIHNSYDISRTNDDNFDFDYDQVVVEEGFGKLYC